MTEKILETIKLLNKVKGEDQKVAQQAINNLLEILAENVSENPTTTEEVKQESKNYVYAYFKQKGRGESATYHPVIRYPESNSLKMEMIVNKNLLELQETVDSTGKILVSLPLERVAELEKKLNASAAAAMASLKDAAESIKKADAMMGNTIKRKDILLSEISKIQKKGNISILGLTRAEIE